MISAVLFDLDGLLADTEPLHCRAYQEALQALGVTLSREAYEAHWIRDGKGVAEYIAEHGLDLDIDAARAGKKIHYDRLVREECAPMPGAIELLQTLRGNKRLALASSSYRHSVDAVLAALGAAHYFECIVSSDDVAKVKPDPALFLCAAHRLEVPPGECVVLEDAEKGVRAAAAAGMTCIAVPNACTQQNDFSQAAVVVSSLHEVTLERIESLAQTP